LAAATPLAEFQAIDESRSVIGGAAGDLRHEINLGASVGFSSVRKIKIAID